MGKAGILPDLTSTFSYWRKRKDDSLKSGDWDTMALALRYMNGALDLEYRIPMSTELWNEQKDGYQMWKCFSCTTTETKTINKGEDNEYTKEVQVPTCSKRKDVEKFVEKCSGLTAFLSESKTRKMWICPKCKNVSSVKLVESQLMKHKQPHYRGCIYDEPTRPLTGLMLRHGIYPKGMRMWGEAYSIELEHQLALYRQEYLNKYGVDIDDNGYKDEGDK